MKNSLKVAFSFFFIFCLSANANSRIIETPFFYQVFSYVSSDTLLILDIDDTLLIPRQMLGCDEWFQTRLRDWQNSGISEENALEKSLAEWESVRHITKMQIVEPQTDQIIKSLQQRGFKIMGLTTQGLALATRTEQQLLENHIDLNATAPSEEDVYLKTDRQGVLYRNGILFTSGTSKGKALFRFLDKIHFHPKRIVFLNDKASHLQDVEEYASFLGMDFIGLRYSYSDSKKNSFKKEIAEIQFKHSSFEHILTDEEAELLSNELILSQEVKH